MSTKEIVEPISQAKPIVKRRFRLSNTQFSLLLLSPALLIMAFTVLYPLIRSIWLSFHSYSLINLMAGMQWVGFENFKTLLASSAYRDVWSTTLLFVVFSVGGQFLIGFLTALVLNQDLVLRNLFRGLLLIPWVVPTVVTALLFKWIFNQQY
jgi:multiple sugar transport system permease protein